MLMCDRTGMVRELNNRVDWRGLIWFGQMERMDEESLVKKVIKLVVSGRRLREKPRF